MQLNTYMPSKLTHYFEAELFEYQKELQAKNYRTAWERLERAHVIGQKYPYEHSLVHWKMLLFGIEIKDGKEIIGQIPRLLIGGVKSFVGKIPVGNTGGANVPPLKPLEIDKDILEIFAKAEVELN
ncbi:MAG: hypothetical protein ACI8YQ_002624 [Polaribacter sp.]|jgi:hypothetical protein